jgi:hypothetical protein
MTMFSDGAGTQAYDAGCRGRYTGKITADTVSGPHYELRVHCNNRFATPAQLPISSDYLAECRIPCISEA